MTLLLALRTIHVCANLLWIGSIVAVAMTLRVAGLAAQDRGRIALALYRTLASPAFGISFLAGLTMLMLAPAYYFVQTHVMHAKLPLAFGVIALHHWLGLKSKQMARGTATTPPGLLPVISLVVASMGAAVLVLMKPF